jgi:hypothetical protein
MEEFFGSYYYTVIKHDDVYAPANSPSHRYRYYLQMRRCTVSSFGASGLVNLGRAENYT